VQILRDLFNLKNQIKREMNLASWRIVISLRNLTILAAKGEDKESKKWLKQVSKNISFFSIFFQFFNNYKLNSCIRFKRGTHHLQHVEPKNKLQQRAYSWIYTTTATIFGKRKGHLPSLFAFRPPFKWERVFGCRLSLVPIPLLSYLRASLILHIS
jgi:hypothetical protein